MYAGFYKKNYKLFRHSCDILLRSNSISYLRNAPLSAIVSLTNELGTACSKPLVLIENKVLSLIILKWHARSICWWFDTLRNAKRNIQLWTNKLIISEKHQQRLTKSEEQFGIFTYNFFTGKHITNICTCYGPGGTIYHCAFTLLINVGCVRRHHQRVVQSASQTDPARHRLRPHVGKSIRCICSFVPLVKHIKQTFPSQHLCFINQCYSYDYLNVTRWFQPCSAALGLRQPPIPYFNNPQNPLSSQATLSPSEFHTKCLDISWIHLAPGSPSDPRRKSKLHSFMLLSIIWAKNLTTVLKWWLSDPRPGYYVLIYWSSHTSATVSRPFPQC